jgi:zinc and cadmium transporter
VLERVARGSITETLLWIIGGTVAGGVLSLLLAAAIAFSALMPWVDRMVSYAVGALLGAAFLELLPEALYRAAFLRLQSGTPWKAGAAESLFAAMLAGVIAFFLLEKAALWRHFHQHGRHAHVKPSGLLIIVGDGFHNFVDGVAIAAAFLVDSRLGASTTLAIMAHEIPQELGDFMILIDAGYSRRRALAYNLLSSLTSIAGGIAGYLVLGHALTALPYVLVISAASFIYIAVADLMPDLRRGSGGRSAAWQVALIATGVGSIALPHFFGVAH